MAVRIRFGKTLNQTMLKCFFEDTAELGGGDTRALIDRADDGVRAEIETLIARGTISRTVQEDLTYDKIHRNANNLWSFLFFTGYLKKTGDGRLGDGGEWILDLSIPNTELRYIYTAKIREWFDERVTEKNLDRLFDAILGGDVETFRAELSKLLAESISFMDSAENFYHGFMVGILSRLNGYLVKSNRESGAGRSDLVMYGVSIMDKAVIFELKMAKKFRELPAACEEALRQIEENNYTAYWDDEGYVDIMKYGIAFYRKNCEVRIAPPAVTPAPVPTRSPDT